MITSKHLFFLIIGLNILVTVFFWNVAKQPSLQNSPTSSASPSSIVQVSSEIQAKKLSLYSAGDKSPTASNNVVGQYLKARGAPTYVHDDDDPDRNYNDLTRAKANLKAAKALKEFNITLDKNSFAPDDVVQILTQTAQKFKDQGGDLTHNYKAELENLLAEYTYLNNSATKLREELAITNPFRYYGLYVYMQDELFNAAPSSKARYYQTFYGIKKEQGYCDLVDMYNLYHPSNIYNNINFVVDYSAGALVRDDVCKKMGTDAMPDVSMMMKNQYTPQFPLNINATMFFTKRINFHHFHEISVHFACLTQEYGHIPGHGVLTRKDLNVQSVNNYAKRYADKPKCFNRKTFFPMAFRLNIEEECLEFFKYIDSDEYEQAKPKEPLQFIMKVGHSAHRASGLELFNEKEEKRTREYYANGGKCGKHSESMVAQYYISNPLLLDKQNKFDFRIYMLIASVNPLIVYYHDGFLRLSLQEYDKWSDEKSVHFTNTHLSKEVFAKAAEFKEYKGMTEEQLREYQMWSMEQLSEYLNKIGKVKDPNWLDNYLRPKFQEAFIHTVRMSEGSFLKHSGVYEMFGLDFLLDDDLNLWFIECNASPQLIGTNDAKTKFLVTLLTDMFEIQHAYLKSRFKRIQDFMAKFHTQVAAGKDIDKRKIRSAFAPVVQNRLEPEFKIRENNTFTLIMDKNIKGAGAYFGHLKEECVDDDK